jgi:hypothetical protein
VTTFLLCLIGLGMLLCALGIVAILIIEFGKRP